MSENKLYNALRALLEERGTQQPMNTLSALYGTAQARTPTWRERGAGLLQDGIEALGADRYRARKIAETVMGGPSSNLPLGMGLVDPTVVGSAFGRQESPNMGPGAPGGLSHAATVFHGSPHKFDRFDSSKIGTGEGAQAYGHGLYLAESPKVAESYSGKLSSELTYRGRPMQRESGRNSKDSAAWALYLADGDKEAAKASGLAAPHLIDALDPTKLKPGGQLYSVDIPDPLIARMLDWDKPLSQQSQEIQSAFAKIGVDSGMTGQQAYRAAHEAAIRSGKAQPAAQKERQAVEQLRRAGIPGIRYLDGGSRSAGAGSSNFVVFPGEESALRILTRNGAPLP